MSAALETLSALPAACDLAANYGIPVFPCKPTKAPYTAQGFHDASTDLDAIEAWWTRWPDALVGVPSGEASGLLVVDVDPDGEGWYREHFDRLACARIHKPRRGHHLLYRMPESDIRCSTGKVAPGVDIRAEGGYVCWWAAHGFEAVGDLADLTAPPAWLLTLLERPQETRSAPTPSVTADQWARVLQALESIDASSASYQRWLEVGMALHSTRHAAAFAA